MQRDKRGRFVKKASLGTVADQFITINGFKYKVKPEAKQAFTLTQGRYSSMDEWLKSSDGWQYLEYDFNSPNNGNLNLGLNIPSLNLNTSLNTSLNTQQNTSNNLWEPTKINLTMGKNGKFVDSQGNEIGLLEQAQNPDLYNYDVYGSTSVDNAVTDVASNDSIVNTESGTESGTPGIRTFSPKDNNSLKNFTIDRNKLAFFLDMTRAGLGLATNHKIAERALEAEKPFLQDVSESHRSVYGDYRAKIEGEKAAAKLRNMASKPITSDGALQQQMMLEAQIKGQEYIDQGNAADDALIKQTRETAWEQEKENQQQRQAAAMANRQSMLMTQKNKADIENARDSANYSQIVAPFLAAEEQRLREKGAEQEYWKKKYEQALVEKEVWYDPNLQLTDSQKAIRDKYLLGDMAAFRAYLDEEDGRWADYNKLQRFIESEILRRQAALRGVSLPGSYLNQSPDIYSKWRPKSLNYGLNKKKGGTIYKARLQAKTKDNDRAARSIESSKKIAARFLEKAIDALYTYKDVELIAKPSNKKRRYADGGSLPFVGYTPVFATSQSGVSAKDDTIPETKKGSDITTKDILELLKEVDGLPSDIDAIQAMMYDFVMMDKLDPLNLDSTSSIASRYMNLLGKIKKAKANREWYDKAYDKLRTDGALNEYAIDSSGNFIGMNAEGDFKRFSAQQIANKETGDYSILTNSNLLDIRAKYPMAAFNHNLIMEAANGVSMAQVTEHISKTIQGLGTDKTTTQIFGDQSKEVLAGLRQLQQAAQQVGQDLSISQLYEASVFTESQARQAQLALNYLYQTLPTNMQALLFSKTGSIEGVQDLIKTLVDSKLSSNYKLEFSPKKDPSKTGKSGKSSDNGFELSPAQMLQQGYGERESILIQDATTTGLRVEGITMPITKNNNETIGQATLEDVATSQFGGLLNFTNASMGGQIIPFEGRKNIAIDGSKIYSMYLPIDQEELVKGNIVPDLDLIDKVNAVNKKIKEEQITDPNKINECYIEAGLPVYMNSNGTVVPTSYRRFGVLNGTAIDNAFGKDFVASKYLKEIDDEDIIKGAISIMNYGRNKEDRIEYDAKNFFNFGGLLGDYDSVYQGTIFIPMSNDVFLGIAGSGKTIDSDEALQLEALQQQHQKVMTTYKNPGQLQ